MKWSPTRYSAPVLGGALLLALGACEAKKSANPLSPSVAGPIAGVTISAPVLLEPAQGFKFKESEQPIRLVIQNATSTGVRPLSYTFEVAADSNFANKVFSRSGVAPGDGRTSVQVDRLEIGRPYYWRARAEDGANTGAFASAGFEIYPKPAVNPPVPVSPVNNALVSSTATLTVQNASFVGPVGRLGYNFQVSSDQGFGQLVAGGIVPEGAGQTTFTTTPLAGSATYYWRARVSDGETTSAWTGTQVFRTAGAPAPGPGPSPPPGDGGSCASSSGPAIVECVSRKYASYRAAGVSASQRRANMEFLRDRIIEAGLCGGLDLGWNLKRGGPEISADFLVQRRGGQDTGIDIGVAYDDTSRELQLQWQESVFPFYKAYPKPTCNGV